MSSGKSELLPFDLRKRGSVIYFHFAFHVVPLRSTVLFLHYLVRTSYLLILLNCYCDCL